MRGTETETTSDFEGEIESSGEGGVPGGGEPHWVDAFILGSDGFEKSGRPPPLSEPSVSKPRIHDVYALIDERSETVFYVGYTRQWPSQRFSAHRHDPFSAAHPRIREIEAAGGAARIQVIASYGTKEEALLHEAQEIASRKGLVNRSPGQIWSAIEALSLWEPEQPKIEPDGDYQEHERLLGGQWHEPA